jgi:hypothetical protein
VAVGDGFGKSTQWWAGLLRSWRRRGMATPVPAVGDGAWFSKAVREVFPDTEGQRCWFQVSSNVVAALPKSVHPSAKSALAQIHNAKDGDQPIKPGQRVGGRLPGHDHRAHRGAAGVLPPPGPAPHPAGCHYPIEYPSSRYWPPCGWAGGSPTDPPRRRALHVPTRWLHTGRAPGSTRARSPNDPTNRAVISTSRDTPIPRLFFPHSARNGPPPNQFLDRCDQHFSKTCPTAWSLDKRSARRSRQGFLPSAPLRRVNQR